MSKKGLIKRLETELQEKNERLAQLETLLVISQPKPVLSERQIRQDERQKTILNYQKTIEAARIQLKEVDKVVAMAGIAVLCGTETNHMRQCLNGFASWLSSEFTEFQKRAYAAHNPIDPAIEEDRAYMEMVSEYREGLLRLESGQDNGAYLRDVVARFGNERAKEVAKAVSDKFSAKGKKVSKGIKALRKRWITLKTEYPDYTPGMIRQHILSEIARRDDKKQFWLPKEGLDAEKKEWFQKLTRARAEDRPDTIQRELLAIGD